MSLDTLKISQIRENFSTTYYVRGRNYFMQDHVLSIDVFGESGDSVELSAQTRGSGYQPYDQVVGIRWNGLDSVDIFGRCTCPLGVNCKHVVAVCLQYQASLSEANSEDSCMSWLAEFVGDESAEVPASNNEFLLYLLKPTQQKGQLAVEMMISRNLKKGGYGKGREVRIGQISNDYYQPNYLQDTDKEIMRLLEACPKASWASPNVLEGELGYIALNKMLVTGRCHWKDHKGEKLALAGARPFIVEWQHDDKGSATLSSQVEGGGMALLTTPVLYLDSTKHQVGVLDKADYTPSQLKKLLASVSVPAKQLTKFSQKLVTILPNSMPPPEVVKTREIKQAPQPRILLRAIPGQSHDIHRIHLDFLYAGHAVSARPFNEVESLKGRNELVQVWRDHAVELAAITRLIDLGFTSLPNESGKGLFFIAISNNYLESLTLWQDFMLNVIPQLLDDNWLIEKDENFQLTFHQDNEWHSEVEGDNDWFELRFDIMVNDKKYPLLPLITNILGQYDVQELPEVITVPLENNEYVVLPREKIMPVVDVLYELYNSRSLTDDGALKMSRFDAARLDDLEQIEHNELHWQAGDTLRELGKKLNNFDGIKTVNPPKGLEIELRDYQQLGLNWLQFLREYQFSGVLADDMGLGKTVQTLAHLLLEKQQGRMQSPCLIIAPTSLMSNWQREARKFTPELKVLILQGADRHQHFDQLDQYDLILSTYPLLVRDETVLMQHTYHYLVLDEAQVIKNPKSKAAQVVRRLKTEHRLCLTGTPMENHLGELWALFDFLMPGLLGDSKQFNQLFRTPIEKHQDYEQRQRLSKRITPFMLRRTKGEVASELPAKSEIIRTVSLGPKQAALYEGIRISMEKKVRDAIASKGLARSHITILDALLKLRQCCCDPQLLKLKQAGNVHSSAKLELLMTMLPEMVEEGRRILLFSSFTQMLSIIEQQLIDRDISYSKLTGQTRKRDEAIERFTSGQADVFLISLKAGGVGLNLTEADTVIHYDPWWNPAAENQATDRAHRIGQKKAVFVYKLITENTLEEKILAMQAKKQALIDGVYEKDNTEGASSLSKDDLKSLFAPLSGEA